MTKKKLKLISNIIFAVTTLFALYTLGMIARDYIALMGTDACPISKHNGLVYTSLGLLFGSMVITSFLDAKAKKMEDKVEADIYDKTLENRKQDDAEPIKTPEIVENEEEELPSEEKN